MKAYYQKTTKRLPLYFFLIIVLIVWFSSLLPSSCFFTKCPPLKTPLHPFLHTSNFLHLSIASFSLMIPSFILHSHLLPAASLQLSLCFGLDRLCTSALQHFRGTAHFHISENQSLPVGEVDSDTCRYTSLLMNTTSVFLDSQLLPSPLCVLNDSVSAVIADAYREALFWKLNLLQLYSP